MHIYYEEGPPRVVMGEAGEFERGVSRDIDDKLAEQILKKTLITFKAGEKSLPPSTGDTPPIPPGDGAVKNDKKKLGSSDQSADPGKEV